MESIGKSLLQQELRCGYVTNEVGMLFRIINCSYSLHSRLKSHSNSSSNSDSQNEDEISLKGEYIAEMTIGLDALLSTGTFSILLLTCLHLTWYAYADGDSSDRVPESFLPHSDLISSPYSPLSSPLIPGSQSHTLHPSHSSLSLPHTSHTPINTHPTHSSYVSAGHTSHSDGLTEGMVEELVRWGPHLLPAVLKYSTLANELRSLYHSLLGTNTYSNMTRIFYYTLRRS